MTGREWPPRAKGNTKRCGPKIQEHSKKRRKSRKKMDDGSHWGSEKYAWGAGGLEPTKNTAST